MNAKHNRIPEPALAGITPSITGPAGESATGRRRWRTTRRGAAAVEMAVVTPLLLLMMFGIMEFGITLMHKESLTNACREACRVRVLKGATDTEARTRFNGAMAGTGLTVATNQLAITAATQPNADIIYTVTATIPRNSLSIFGLTTMVQRFMQMFASGSTMNGTTNVIVSCSMRGEG